MYVCNKALYLKTTFDFKLRFVKNRMLLKRICIIYRKNPVSRET